MPLKKYVVAMLAVAAAIASLEAIGSSVNGATAAQVLLLVLLLDARFCGTGPAIVASAGAALGFARYFVTGSGFAIGDPNDWAALAAFVIMAVVIGELASRAERRAIEAQEGRQEIARLYQELQAAFDRASEAEAARRNEQLKAALLDALTHNLRTPLTAIKASVTALIAAESWRGTAELSRDGAHELLEVIDEESDRLNRFIEGLSTPRATETAQPISLRSVPLGPVIRAGLARAETVTRDHRVVLDIDDDLPAVSIDEASVVEVLYILLDNASKYAPPDTTIRVSASVDVPPFVRITVTDHGPGIAPELRERVFERFFRIPAREPADPHRSGIGLGLPIARRLVEAQGGQIWIDTPANGHGTVVVVRLPLSVDVIETQPPTAVPVAAR